MKKRLLVLALAALLPVATAGADTVSIDYRGHGLGYDGKFTAKYWNPTTRSYAEYSGFAGQLLIKGLSGDETDIAYCLDFFENLSDPETATVRPIADYPNGGNAPAHALAGVGTMIGWLLNQEVTDNLHAAALQLAIWEVAFDTGLNLGSGLFTVVNTGSHWGSYYSTDYTTVQTMLGYAASYLAGLGTSTDAVWLDVAVNCRTHGQDLGVATEPTPDPVPEPASMMLLGSGLLGLGAAARRKRAGRK